jgi:hypothetical protein
MLRVHTGPGAALPNFAAKAGIKVLGSKPLRSLANQIAYYDKKQFATEDAMRIGRCVYASNVTCHYTIIFE